MRSYLTYGFLISFSLLVSCVAKKAPSSSLEKVDLNTAGISSVSKKESKAQYKFIKAEGLFLLEEYDNALVSLDTVLVYSPQNPAVFYKKSQCYERLADLGNAVLFAEKAIKGNNRNEEYHRQLAEIYKQEKEYLKSITAYRAMVSAIPSATYSYAEIAKNYSLLAQESQTKYDFHSTKSTDLDKKLALEALKKVSVYNNQTVEAWSIYEKSFELSDDEFMEKQKLLCELDRKDEALIESIERVKNGHPEMLWNHVSLLLKVRTKSEAIGFVEAYETNSLEEQVEKHRVLGILYFKNNETTKGSTEFSSILQKDVAESMKSSAFLSVLETEKSDETVLVLADLLSSFNKRGGAGLLQETEGDFYAYNLTDTEKAKQAYKEALKTVKDNEEVLVKLIKLENDTQDYEALLSHASVLLQSSVLEVGVYKIISNAYVKKDKSQKAIEVLHKGLNEVGRDYELENDFFSSLAGIHEQLGDYDSVFYYFEKSLEYAINDGELINKYCQKILAYNGDLDVARANGERMIRLYPNSSTYHKTYAQVMFKMEEYERALAYLEKAIELGDNSKDIYSLATIYAQKNGDLVKAKLYDQKKNTAKDSD